MRRRQFLAATAVTAFLRAASPTAALARQQLLSGLYQDAVASYAAALTERDSDPELHAGYIHALVAAKKARAAADATSRARDRFGDDPHVIAAHARVLFRQARLAEASQGFKQAIDKNPKIPEAWAGLARCYSVTSMPEAAERFFQSAFRLEPNDADLAQLHANSLEDFEEHIQRLEAALALYGAKAEAVAPLRVHIETDKLLRGRNLRELKSPYGPYQLPLAPLRNAAAQTSAWGLEVRFNGKAMARLMVDTGASGILLASNGVKKFGLDVLSNEKTELRGVGDDKAPKSTATLANSVEIGDLRFANFPVRVSDSRRIGGSDGLIGTDVFSKFLVTMDPPKRKLTLAPIDDPDGKPRDRQRTEANKHYSAVMRSGSHFFLPVGVNGKAQGLFLLDTGASSNLLSEDLSRQVSSVSREDRVEVRGVSGKVDKVYRAERVELSFARLRQNMPVALAFDLEKSSDEFGFAMGGLLGREALDVLRMTLDYRNGLVELAYDKR